jgi:hypothetical protein
VDLEEPITKVSTVEGYISYVFKEETFCFEMFIYTKHTFPAVPSIG